MKREKKKTVYRFEPYGFDIFDRRSNQPEVGQLVVKVQPFGCPRNGTMGHCFVEPADGSGHFSLVCEQSLVRV